MVTQPAIHFTRRTCRRLCSIPLCSTSWSPPRARPRARSSAISAKSKNCRSRSRARQFRHRRRSQRRGDRCTPSSPRRGRATVFSARKAAGTKARTRRIAGSSIRSMAPPISCTASRNSPSRSRSSAKAPWSPGLIYNPASDDMFFAERGKGAFLNEQRIRVAARKRLADAVVACGLPHHGNVGIARPSSPSFQLRSCSARSFSAPNMPKTSQCQPFQR